MTDTDTEVERIAELAWRAYTQCTFVGAWPRGAVWENDWRRVARAVIADRAAQPPVTDGPTLTAVADERDDAMAARVTAECVTAAALTRAVTAERERDEARRDAKRTAAECDRAVADARRERDAARARSVGAERERDALQSRLDALATREPTADEIARLEDEWEHAIGPVARWWWRRIRDALLTAQERHCWHGPACSGTGPECGPDGTAQEPPAGEALRLIEQGRQAERAAVVAWLHQIGAAPADVTSHSLHDAADSIERGDHLAAKEPQP